MSRSLLSLLLVGFILTTNKAFADRVVIVGDSHTAVMGPLLVQEYQDRGVYATFIRHNGWSARRYKERANLIDHIGSVDRAVVILGGNNRRVQDAAYWGDISWVLSELRSAGASEITWVGPLWCSSRGVRRRHRRTRDMQQRLFSSHGLSWFDVYDLTRGFPLGGDGVHYTSLSYSRIVSEILVPTLFP